MARLINAVTSPGPSVPETLTGKLSFLANCPLTQEEANEFNLILNELANELEEDGITREDLTRVTAIFTRDNKFEIEDVGDDPALGLHFSLAVYAMDRIRDKRREVGQIASLMVYIEELVHHYWRLEDEVETKVKAARILSRIYNQEIQVTDLFPREWLNAELIRQGMEPRY
ncbi:hypothetical protein [Cytobacillus firmus]|uniref:hypothetical protein n=1 Tax=Cytobacillus firmus TaxID=1399 RepID=UPI00064E439E|nr:hypothetical protein [Cytobacillus firmus]KML40622.1 hypothetical protein VL14_13255 [Cytobacillus firmus]